MEKPADSDCCGSGCNPCIFDVYENFLKNLENSKPVVQLLNPLKYTPFVLKDFKEIVDDIFLYTFETLDEKMEIHLDITNFAILRGDDFSRPYTILSNDLLQMGCFQVIIKLYPNGKMSEKLRNIQIGDELFWRGPYCHFQLPQTRHLTLVGSGTGILPLFNIAKCLTSDEKCETLIHVIGCFKNLENVLLRKELHELTKFWNCRVEFFVEEVTSTRLFYKEKITFQKLDCFCLKEFFVNKSQVAVSCGSRKFNQFIEEIAEDCGIILTVL